MLNEIKKQIKTLQRLEEGLMMLKDLDNKANKAKKETRTLEKRQEKLKAEVADLETVVAGAIKAKEDALKEAEKGANEIIAAGKLDADRIKNKAREKEEATKAMCDKLDEDIKTKSATVLELDAKIAAAEKQLDKVEDQVEKVLRNLK